MSEVMLGVLQRQVESLTRQVEVLGPENERVRKLLTEFDRRHDLDRAEIERLTAIINRPENDDFLRGVSIEAEHQRQRWGDDHDARKSGWDWFWTIGFLSQKAAAAFEAGNIEKAKHHCISTAALMSNMHRFVAKSEVEGREEE